MDARKSNGKGKQASAAPSGADDDLGGGGGTSTKIQEKGLSGRLSGMHQCVILLRGSLRLRSRAHAVACRSAERLTALAERLIEGMDKHQAAETASRERIARMEIDARAAAEAASFERLMRLLDRAQGARTGAAGNASGAPAAE